MSAINQMVQLRLFVVLCVGIGLPFLTLGGAARSLREGAFPLSTAPMIYLVTVAFGLVIFFALRSAHASKAAHAFSGVALGLTPGLVFSLSSLFSPAPLVLWATLAVGFAAGAFSGLALWRGDDGFSS